MTSLNQLGFFITPEHDCSYLQGYKAQTLFTDPASTVDTPTYTELTQLGFRRSGKHIYRPHCKNCKACISTRILVKDFSPSRNQKRLLNKNSDIDWKSWPPSLREDYFRLYCLYINARHVDGDMHPPSLDQFESFLVEGRSEARFYEMRLNSRLVGVSVVDWINDGVSAIYTFFDPAEGKRSLGSFAILKLIEECRQKGLEHVYLGYWIRNSEKMNYKIRFIPLQLFIEGNWYTVTKDMRQSLPIKLI